MFFIFVLRVQRSRECVFSGAASLASELRRLAAVSWPTFCCRFLASSAGTTYTQGREGAWACGREFACRWRCTAVARHGHDIRVFASLRLRISALLCLCISVALRLPTLCFCLSLLLRRYGLAPLCSHVSVFLSLGISASRCLHVACLCVSVCLSVSVCVCARVWVSLRGCVSVCLCLYVLAYLCVSFCVSVFGVSFVCVYVWLCVWVRECIMCFRAPVSARLPVSEPLCPCASVSLSRCVVVRV